MQWGPRLLMRSTTWRTSGGEFSGWFGSGTPDSKAPVKMNRGRIVRNPAIWERLKRDDVRSYYAPTSDSRRQPRMRSACRRSRPFDESTVCSARRELVQAKDHELVAAIWHVTSLNEDLVVSYTWGGLRTVRSPLEGCEVAQTPWV